MGYHGPVFKSENRPHTNLSAEVSGDSSYAPCTVVPEGNPWVPPHALVGATFTQAFGRDEPQSAVELHVKHETVAVSVVIPVFNDAEALERCLRQLQMQTHDHRRFEVIVVDNGSTDHTREVATSFPGVKLLVESTYRNSPYSARNRAIEIARGAVIALIDANCYPDPEWLSEAVSAMEGESADLVAGNVLFDITEPFRAAHIVDGMTNIRMRESVEKKSVAKTANLIVKKDVFNQLGLFPEGLRSGGDVRWTGEAVSIGLKLVFAENAVVRKAPRDWAELLKKQWRVARGQPAIWKEPEKHLRVSELLGKMLIPPRIRTTKRKAENVLLETVGRTGLLTIPLLLKIWFLRLAVQIVMGFAHIVFVLKQR
ncbi:Glycosyl transferase family 2 [Alkalispirochaeta americana]|uniref:Glycosyl transferase family 2 n=1 Tax=Alkalispirochaeta americana TaxID=159291 RepID=A0A1N6RU22_9SPIO|nr:Glycosyl transferase family 2 [Alkalispirochaeta americana]